MESVQSIKERPVANVTQHDTTEGGTAPVSAVKELRETLDLDSIGFKVYHAWLASAENEFPGFSSSVSAAYATAAFTAAAKTFGATGKWSHLRLNPPVGTLVSMSDALSKMSAASFSPSRVVSRPTAKAAKDGRKPSGKLPKGKGPQKGRQIKPKRGSQAPTRATAAPPRGNQASARATSGKPVVDKPQSADGDQKGSPKDPRKNLLKKALRSFNGSGQQAKLARKLGLTVKDVETKILALTDEQIKFYRELGHPALAYTGIFDDQKTLKDWVDDVEKDEWLQVAARRSTCALTRSRIVSDWTPKWTVQLPSLKDAPSPRTAAKGLAHALQQVIREDPSAVGGFVRSLTTGEAKALKAGQKDVLVRFDVKRPNSDINPATVHYSIQAPKLRVTVKGHMTLTKTTKFTGYLVSFAAGPTPAPLPLSFGPPVKRDKGAGPDLERIEFRLLGPIGTTRIACS